MSLHIFATIGPPGGVHIFACLGNFGHLRPNLAYFRILPPYGKTSFYLAPAISDSSYLNSSNNYEDSCGDERLFV